MSASQFELIYNLLSPDATKRSQADRDFCYDERREGELDEQWEKTQR